METSVPHTTVGIRGRGWKRKGKCKGMEGKKEMGGMRTEEREVQPLKM